MVWNDTHRSDPFIYFSGRLPDTPDSWHNDFFFPKMLKKQEDGQLFTQSQTESKKQK